MKEWEVFEQWMETLKQVDFDFERPTPLDFTPAHKKDFSKRKIVNTPLAPVWGQHSSYFSEPLLEINAGPRQNDDPFVKYQQAWIESNFTCPFCTHGSWNLSYAVGFNPKEQFVFDPYERFYILLCPSCERAVEAIPRQMVDEL